MADRESRLSRPAILREMEAGNIHIEPFKIENLGTAQYDASLGEFYYTEDRQRCQDGNIHIYNPYDQSHVERVWGGPEDFKTAITAKEWKMKNNNYPLENIADDDRIIILPPGATILAHTQEFIGGHDNKITTMMKARSSMGRNFIEVCKCAGLGDIGYCNRWTMEITNNAQDHATVLVVGRRIAQIIFDKTEGITDEDYTNEGKYQTTGDLEKMMKDWHPSAMLPKMYKDREVIELHKTG